MRIAMVFDGLGFGGIESVGIRYASLLIKYGHQVDVYNLRGDKCDLVERMREVGCDVYSASLPLSLVPHQYMLMVKRWWWGKYAYPIAYLVSKTGMLFLRTVRHRERYDVAIAFSGHMRDLTFVAYDFVRSDKKVAWLHGALMEYLVLSPSFSDLYRIIGNLFVISLDRQDSVFQAWPFLESEVSISQIYNPIDLTDRMPNYDEVRRLKERYGDFILMVGRLDSDKDQATVINARKRLELDFCQTPNVVFVGDGTERQQLEELVDAMDLRNSVFFEGAKDNVEDYYAAASISVHSSPSEGFPTVLLESMKYSLPIVATDSPPGVTEILGNDEYGLRCKVGDASDMAKKLNIMLTNEEMREHYIEQGQRRVKQFSYEVIGDRLNSLINKL